jgi:hypothetical protein
MPPRPHGHLRLLVSDRWGFLFGVDESVAFPEQHCRAPGSRQPTLLEVARCSSLDRVWSLLLRLLIRAVSTPRVAASQEPGVAIAIRAMFGRESRLAFALRGRARARGKD